jgi:hypothetical protein
MLFEFSAVAALVSSALLIQGSRAGFSERATPVITKCSNHESALTFDGDNSFGSRK